MVQLGQWGQLDQSGTGRSHQSVLAVPRAPGRWVQLGQWARLLRSGMLPWVLSVLSVLAILLAHAGPGDPAALSAMIQGRTHPADQGGQAAQ